MVDDLNWEGGSMSVTLLLLLDLSATSDTNDHDILLEWLLWDGTHMVLLLLPTGLLPVSSIGGLSLSLLVLVLCGFTGYHLFPMPFNIYMKPLGGIIQEFLVNYHHYVDDTHSPNMTSESSEAVDLCLHMVYWLSFHVLLSIWFSWTCRSTLPLGSYIRSMDHFLLLCYFLLKNAWCRLKYLILVTVGESLLCLI